MTYIHFRFLKGTALMLIVTHVSHTFDHNTTTFSTVAAVQKSSHILAVFLFFFGFFQQ